MHARTFLRGTAAVSLAVGGLLLGSAGSAVADTGDTPVVVQDVAGNAADTPTDAPADPAADSPADSPAGDAAAATDADAGAEGPAPRGVRAAYSSLSISPAGPYKGGETVTVRGSGFTADEQVVLSICLGGQKLAGPQDCAPLNGDSSAIGAANGSGVASLKIKVIKGDLGAQSKPGHVCGNGANESCVFSLTNFGGDGPAAVRVKYVESGDSGKAEKSSKKKSAKSDSDGDTATDSGTGDSGDQAAAAGTDSTSGGAEVANTGAGSALTTAALGAALLALGLVLSLAGRHRTPRTTRA